MTATRITAAPFLGGVEVPAGFEPAIRVLQTRALPLGYGARPGASGRNPPAVVRQRVYHARARFPAVSGGR